MSTDCKWDNYCSSKKQGAKTACLENQKQQRLFEEQFVNLQFDGLIEQATLQYQICVQQCGGCQSCPCVDQCSDIKQQAIASINRFRQQQLDQIRDKYECCDEALCESQSNYLYQWCCANNGPLAGDLRNSSSPWSSASPAVFEPPVDGRSLETQAFYNYSFTSQELTSPDGVSTTRAEERSASDTSSLIKPTIDRDWEQYSRGIRACINLMIRTHGACVEAAKTEWAGEDARITTIYNKDMTTCFDQYWLCVRSGTTTQEVCNSKKSVCEKNAETKRDTSRKTNDDRYKGKSGRDIPPSRGTDQPLPDRLPPYKNPPCLCCQISDDAYARCRERAWQGDPNPDREPKPQPTQKQSL